MDRRTFARTLSAAGLGLAGCGRGTPTAPDARTPPPPPPPPPSSPPRYDTDAERALGVAAGLLRSGEPASGGTRWPVMDAGVATYPTDLYGGQAGVLAFLAEAYRERPDAPLRDALERGGRWLRAQPLLRRPGLFIEGDGSRVWAFLSLHEALGGAGAPWLEAALAVAPGVAASTAGVGDLVSSLAGTGLLMLRLHHVTGDARWLDAARGMAERILADAVRTDGDGLKFRSFTLPDGRPVFYTGLAHGAAGAGYFLCRLAQALPGSRRAAAAHGAEATARWLDAVARPRGAGLTWYRREPDQTGQQQMQWCHGPPGIGLFYAELHRLTGSAAHLDTAVRCAAAMDAEREHASACQCHGLAGNAQLYLALHRRTGDAAWLDAARRYGELLWERRLRGTEFPEWTSGDSSRTHTPSLMTGTTGVGWLYLQLARAGALGAPGLDWGGGGGA